MLDVGAKRRLVGAVVLVVLAVIFLPMWVEDQGAPEGINEDDLRMPAQPQVDRDRGQPAEVFPSLEETGPRPVSGAAGGAAPPPAGTPSESASQAPAGPGLESAPAVSATPPQRQPAPGLEAAKSAEGPPVAVAPKPEAARPRSTLAEPPAPKAQAAAPAAPKPVPKGLTSWVVQVAALSTPEAAQRLQGDLRSKGFHAFVEKADGQSRTLWRVRVGPEVDRARAEAIANDVKKRTGLDAIVRKYRG